MLLRAGIDADGLPPDLECHHLFVNDWADVTAEQNVCIASVPSVFDPSLAPAGKAQVHAYCAANEPWERWEGLDRRSPEYRRLKVRTGTFLQVWYCLLLPAIPPSRNAGLTAPGSWGPSAC